MNCTEYQERASLLLDDPAQLPSEELRAVQRHLQQCDTCRFDHELERATRDVLRRRFPHHSTPRSVYESVQIALQREYASERK